MIEAGRAQLRAERTGGLNGRVYEMVEDGRLGLPNDVDDARQLANFMRYFNSNLARELGRLHHWTDRIWSRRYQAIVISAEEAEQV